MCHASNEKWQTTSDGMEPPNQDKIRMLGEKEMYKYSKMEADTIKQVKMKEKNQERISQNKKATRDKTIKQKPYQRNKYLC